MTRRAVTACVLALGVAVASDAGADAKTIVLPAEASSAKVDAAVLAAAARAAPGATVADASLADSAFIVGCEPATDACRDEVAGQLGVDRLVIVARQGTSVEVLVRDRGGATQRRGFVVSGADDRAGLAAIERDLPALLGASARGDAAGGGGGGGAAPGDGAASRRGPLIVGIGGGVLLVSGFALWGLAASTQADIDDAPTATPADLDHLAALETDGRRYASIGNGLVIGGGLAVVAAGVWILVQRRHERSPVQITPTVAPGTATIRLEASW